MSELDFLKAAVGGDLNTVQLLVDKANVNVKDRDGRTALQLAAVKGYLDIVRFLVARKDVDVNLADNDSQSPVLVAAALGYSAVVTELLLNGASVNQANNNGWSPLFQVAAEGNVSVGTLLLSKGAAVNQADNNGMSPLYIAALRNHDSMAALLLSKGAAVNQADNKGCSPLHTAAMNGHDAMVAVLLSNGADVNQAMNSGPTPIDVAKTMKIKDMLIAHANKQQQQSSLIQIPSNGQSVQKIMDKAQWFEAAGNGDLALIKQGVNGKIDINCRDSKGQTAMFHAVLKGHIQLVEYLISQHADLSIADDNGWYPIHWAAIYGLDAVVALLLANGADVNQADKNGCSTLYWATINGEEAVIALLLSHGADVNQTYGNGWSPLYWAASNGKEEVVAVLLSKGADINQANSGGKNAIDAAKTQKIKDMLIAHSNKQQHQQQQSSPSQAIPKMMDKAQWFCAAQDGDLALIQQGINDKIDVNCRDSEGCTAVYLAAAYGHVQLVEYLINQHADLNIANNKGFSPLHIAVLKVHDNVIVRLLSNGADVNQADDIGRSPLYVAVVIGEDTLVTLLYSQGANVKQVDKNGYSPLHVAANDGNTAMVAVLLSHGADVNQADNRGCSPLYLATLNNDNAMVALLLSKGADGNQPEKSSLFPIYIAASCGYDAVVTELLSKGADINQANNDGLFPLYISAYNGHDAVVALLLSNGADVNQVTNSGHTLIDAAKTQKIKDMLIAHANKQQQQQQQQQPSPSQTPSNGQPVQKIMDKAQWFDAAGNGDLVLIQQGVNDKIDINCRDRKGHTAVYYAAAYGHVQMVKYLISQHADLNIADNEGWAPLHIATLNGDATMVTLLLSIGADVHQVDNTGRSPLSLATLKCHDAVITALLSHGADVNQVANDGRSPLFKVAADGHDAVVALLLSNGADVNQASNEGASPLLMAASSGHDAVVTVLLSHGANVNQAMDSGHTPIDAAKTQKIKDMLIAHAKKNEEVDRNKKEAIKAVLQAATSNFADLTSDQIGDLIVSFGDQYVNYRENIVKKGLTGALIAHAMTNGTLHDMLKEVNVTSKIQLNELEMKFKTFYQPSIASTLVTPPIISSGSVSVNNVGGGGAATAAGGGAVISCDPAVIHSPTKPSADKLHIMMSYCWAKDANPEHVKALADYLRGKGYDVWQDTDGSTICGKMSGGTDDKMAEAVEKSAFVIICVSKAYPTRPNCEQEAKYARAREKDNKLKIIYVMMQSDYTTVSNPERVDGWLGLYIGDSMWYKLWDKNQVESTGDDIAYVIGDRAKVQTASPVLSIPWNSLQFTSAAEDLIGLGAFGRVYKATWLPNAPKLIGSQPVAVKVMTTTGASSLGRDYASERVRALEEAERIVLMEKRGSQVLRDLTIKVYGCAEGILPPEVTAMFRLRDGEEAVGIVMRLEEGGSLEMMLHAGKKQTGLKVDYSGILADTYSKLRIVEQIIRGLTELHAADLIHGDIKPANFLCDGKLPPGIVIADFGLAALRESTQATMDQSSLHGTAHMKGTPVYSAPESLMPDATTGELARSSRSTDVYAFGILVHELLSGRRPFEQVKHAAQLGMMVFTGSRPPLDQLPDDTPSTIIEMIKKCWDIDRSVRPSAAQCLAIVESALSLAQAAMAAGTGLKVARLLSPRK